MNWIAAHLDALIFVSALIIATGSYWIGEYIGYERGLDVGVKAGLDNGTR